MRSQEDLHRRWHLSEALTNGLILPRWGEEAHPGLGRTWVDTALLEDRPERGHFGEGAGDRGQGWTSRACSLGSETCNVWHDQGMQGLKGRQTPYLQRQSAPNPVQSSQRTVSPSRGGDRERVNSSHKSTAFTGKISRKHPINVSHWYSEINDKHVLLLFFYPVQLKPHSSEVTPSIILPDHRMTFVPSWQYHFFF